MTSLAVAEVPTPARRLAAPFGAVGDRPRRLRGRRGVDLLRARERRDRGRAGRASRDFRVVDMDDARLHSRGTARLVSGPASRFGPLMIAAGVICFLVTLSWTTHDFPTRSAGARQAARGGVPPRVPCVPEWPAERSFREGGRGERLCDCDRAGARSYGDRRLRHAQPARFRAAPGAFEVVRNVQLLLLSGLCLIGVGILFERRRRGGRPLRRSVSLLIDSFALGLVMIAVFFVANVSICRKWWRSVVRFS